MARAQGSKEFREFLTWAQPHFFIETNTRELYSWELDVLLRRPPRQTIAVIFKHRIHIADVKRAVPAFSRWHEDFRNQESHELWGVILGRVVSARARAIADAHKLPFPVRAMNTAEFMTDVTKYPLDFGRDNETARKVRIKAVVAANTTELTLACEAMGRLIEEKIVALRDVRPNAQRSIAKRDQEIEELKVLRRQTLVLKKVVSNKDADPEPAVVGFVEGLKAWWTKHHESICNSSLSMGLFISGMAICGMTGSGGAVAVVISGAIASGKSSIVDVLKGLGKKLFK